MKRVVLSDNREYVVVRERLGEHGIELVDVVTLDTCYVRNLYGLDPRTIHRPIRADLARLSDRVAGWLSELRLRRAEYVQSTIKQGRRSATPKVEKSLSDRTRKPRAKARKPSASAELEAKLALLPPELAEKIRASVSKGQA